MKKMLALLLCMFLAPAVSASMVTEVLPLGFRTLEEVVPVLRPLVPAPGTITGMQNQLVIRTTPENLQEIKALLANLDRPPRRLLISVKQERQENLRRSETEVTGSYPVGDLTLSSGRRHSAGPGLNINTENEYGRRAGVRLNQDRSQGSDTGLHRVQTLDGRQAYIRTGTSVPFSERTITARPGGTRMHDTVRYRNVTSGFYVVPRVNGNRVTLEVSPRSMRMSSAGNGILDVQEANTVVSGQLGEWIQVGGATAETDSRGSGTLYSTHGTGDSRWAIMMKVDELP